MSLSPLNGDTVIVSPSSSLSFPAPTHPSSMSVHCVHCGHSFCERMGVQATPVCSFCGNELGIQAASASDQVDGGESKLSRVLSDAKNSTIERELWSCLVIRRSFHLVKVLSKPCVITMQQFLAMLNIFLDSVVKMEGKTGNAHLDKLLSALNMMMYTYRDRHQVQPWRTPKFAISKSSLEEGSESASSTDKCLQSSPTPQSTSGSGGTCTPEKDAQDIEVNQDDSSDVRVVFSSDFMCCQLQECLQECVAQSFMRLGNDHDLTSTHIAEDLSHEGDGICYTQFGNSVNLGETKIANANNNEDFASVILSE